jgi:hypothetical protein
VVAGPGPHSRRAFLLGAGAAILLAGCGRDEAGQAPPPDADVLAGLLAIERAAAAPAGVIGRQDDLHAARLLAALRRAGGRPGASRTLAGGLLERKQQAVFAYFDALPQLAAPELRVLVMRIAASEAEHLSALRLARGAPAVPDAFAGTAAP